MRTTLGLEMVPALPTRLLYHVTQPRLSLKSGTTQPTPMGIHHARLTILNPIPRAPAHRSAELSLLQNPNADRWAHRPGLTSPSDPCPCPQLTAANLIRPITHIPHPTASTGAQAQACRIPVAPTPKRNKHPQTCRPPKASPPRP